ncbi:dephospho-CoA kinase [Flavobacterium aciduliphilum]|uniref:Dephospho-CoA kinase n=1 Tax=Flavobacterium aciduliphilum TaxID=1101402 RepID=A0A328YN05_9FLAO|nr:dephospho-CoA kinase [Flavobacterium aciduliphilum]
MFFSIIIPVYNRPDEIDELLESLVKTSYSKEFEIVIVEDGSETTCQNIVEKYKNMLLISYYYKPNSGPGDSRNFGMKNAKGDYFIIFDSDCIIPKDYLNEVENALDEKFVDCFGGPDKALKSFSTIQKAINFAMTSFITTGGIRGGSEKIDKFQPRSFNMGISKKAFEMSKGFGNIHPGEDPDLSIRLWKLGFDTRLFPKAFVYHKRRIDWEKFSIQVSKFGKARPILNSWYPEYKKITYWFPSLFVIGLVLSFLSVFLLFDWGLKLYFVYFVCVFLLASIQNKSVIIGGLSVIAVWKQFFGYGVSFLESHFFISILKRDPKKKYPKLFFKISEENHFEEKGSFVTEKKIVENTDDKILRIPKIIGLTGGIGSGKTTIAQYLQSKGVPVYISDVEAKKVMEQPEIISKIAVVFGNDILNSDRTINRDKLAALVFKDSEQLKKLNSIVHPAVKKHFKNWVLEHKNAPFIFKETAILFESGGYKDCDMIVTVTAPTENRIERVLKRDNTTRDKIIQRMNNQLSDEERKERSQFVINNENFENTKKEIDQLLSVLLKTQ